MSDTIFYFPLRVYYEDTDAAGVVYYGNYLKFAERVRTEWLRVLGFEQESLWKSHGIGFVVKQCYVDYHAPAVLDDALEGSCQVTASTATTLTMHQMIRRMDKDLATLDIILVCVNAQMKPKRIPQDIRDAMVQYDR